LLFQEALTIIVRIRAGRQRLGDPPVFRICVRNTLRAAENAALMYGYPAADIETVLQALIAFLDESLLNANSPQHAGLHQELFGNRGAGQSFVRNLERLFERPGSATVADVLELHQLCLLLGFQAHLSGLEIRYLLREIGARIESIRSGRTRAEYFRENRRQGSPESQTMTLLLGAAGTGKSSLIAESGMQLEQAAENAWRSGDALLVDGGPIATRRLFRRSDACVAVQSLDCDAFLDPERVETLAQTARESRAMLAGIARGTRAALPVHVVFTKADQLKYFASFIRNFTELEANETVGSPVRGSIGDAFDAVYRSLAAKRAKLLERESDAAELPDIYEFPREFAKLRPLIVEYLSELCGPESILRGFYFTGVAAFGAHSIAQRVWLRRLFPDVVLSTAPARKPPGSIRRPISISRFAGLR
jgi:type IV/VI secretion system ImpK/VasF family protein